VHIQNQIESWSPKNQVLIRFFSCSYKFGKKKDKEIFTTLMGSDHADGNPRDCLVVVVDTLILAPRRLRRDDEEFKANLGYMARPCLGKKRRKKRKEKKKRREKRRQERRREEKKKKSKQNRKQMNKQKYERPSSVRNFTFG
jgi:hypothetical protein